MFCAASAAAATAQQADWLSSFSAARSSQSERASGSAEASANAPASPIEFFDRSSIRSAHADGVVSAAAIDVIPSGRRLVSARHRVCRRQLVLSAAPSAAAPLMPMLMRAGRMRSVRTATLARFCASPAISAASSLAAGSRMPSRSTSISSSAGHAAKMERRAFSDSDTPPSLRQRSAGQPRCPSAAATPAPVSLVQPVASRYCSSLPRSASFAPRPPPAAAPPSPSSPGLPC
mmetsp:Transcript_6054/g.24060  ORF Transcript_6054/g.24060 Transcript_6054/m.24060 type:complete len:233 (-) Transcript_6054:412-1110(-)